MYSTLTLLRQLSIRARTQFYLLVVLGLLALVGTSGAVSGRLLLHLNAEFMDHSLKELKQIGDMTRSLDSMRLAERDMVSDYEHNNRNLSDNLKLWQNAGDTLRAGLNANFAGKEDEDSVVARAALKDLEQYQPNAKEVFQGLQGNAFDSGPAALSSFLNAMEGYAAVSANLDEIRTVIDSEALATKADISAMMHTLTWACGGMLVLAVVLLVPVKHLNSASITGPIGHARAVAQGIAQGELTHDVRIDGKDEASSLLQAPQKIQTHLRELIGQVKESSVSIGTASVEVGFGNSDLSQHTGNAAGGLTSIIGEIANAAGKQSTVIGQVNQDVADLEHMTQQNAALAQQSAAVADSLKDQAQRLSQVVGTFKLCAAP